MIEANTRGAWKDLAARLRPFVARRVPPSDIDDVVQDVFVRMQRGLGALRNDDRFGPWIYQVARSAIVDHQRSRARHPLAGGDPPELADDREEENTTEQMLAAYIAPFIATLASPYREALTLTELEGHTQKDAAARLGISLSGMKSRVQRGRDQLRAILDRECSIARDARGRVIACEPRPTSSCKSC